MVQPPGAVLPPTPSRAVAASAAEATLCPPPAAAEGWKDLEEGRREGRRGGEKRAAPSRSPGGEWRMRGAPRAPPPPGLPPVQGATARPWVHEAGAIGQAMSLGGTEMNQCGAAAGKPGLRLAINSFPFPEPPGCPPPSLLGRGEVGFQPPVPHAARLMGR